MRSLLNPVRRLLCALLLLLTGTVTVAAGPSVNPNIVFVLFDDLGYGQPGSYREDSEFKMPRLDRLAREGMRFTDAHSAAAVCTPTRYGLLTGRYPSRIGQYGVLTTYSAPIIPPKRLTVGALLKQHGYETACIGKWHLGMTWEGKPGNEKTVPVGAKLRVSPNTAGFDFFYGFTHARNIGSIIEQDRVVENVAGPENQPRMVTKAVQWLEQRDAAKPFFLYFPMCPPHTPIAPAPEFAGKGGGQGKEAKYGDWLYQGDHMLGQLLDALERRGLGKNTLVIATSDNGTAGRSYAPLRGEKTSIYEGGHRVPFIARWPGKIKAGAVNDETICLNDLIATCAEITGEKLPDNAAEDSFSLLPALLGTAKGPVREATIHQSQGGDLAIRQGAWKLVFLKNGTRELYNLQTDLSEKTSIAETNPEVVVRLTALMQKYIAEGRSTPGAKQTNEAPIKPGGGGQKKGRQETVK